MKFCYLCGAKNIVKMENHNDMTIERPKRYLALAIISTLFFWPLGIVAIIKSLKVDDYLAMGNSEMAFYASKDAKRFSLFALIIGIVGLLVLCSFTVFAIIVASLAMK